MNRVKSFYQSAKELAKKGKTKIAAGFAAGTAALVAAPAFATTPTIGAQVAALVEEYKEEALIAVFAFIVVLWTLRATGILKPRT